MSSKLIDLNKVIKQEVKKLAKEFREQNGNSSLRIPNKDINLWIVNELVLLRGELALIKLKTKMLMWFFGITIALIGVFRLV